MWTFLVFVVGMTLLGLWRLLIGFGAFVAYMLTWAALAFLASMVYRAFGG